MQQYLDLLEDILTSGVDKEDRTGVGTRSVFGRQLRFDLQQGFPLLTTKKVFVKGVIHELLWFLSGSTNVRYLQERGVHIWDAWADKDGELGPVYGKQWRSWEGFHDAAFKEDVEFFTVDQIKDVVTSIRNNPDSRRHIVTAWNPAEVDSMALPPCHCLFQFYVASGTLSCQLYQRSADVFLGVPFNIASYALLTMMVAYVCDLRVGEFVHTFGDAHIYRNHFAQVSEQLQRVPRDLPRMLFEGGQTELEDFKYEHFKLVGYDPYPAIKATVAV